MHRSPRTTLAPIQDAAEFQRAIRSLHDASSVLVLGIEPDLARHIAELERIAAYGRARLPGALPFLCRELETRLWEVACLELPASVEDLDVFLQLLEHIEFAAHVSAAAELRSTAEAPAASDPPSPRLGRLRARPRADGLELLIPETEDPVQLDRLLEDLTVLAEITPRGTDWTVDCTRLRRVPLALVAHLIDLRREDGVRPRRMRLTGLLRNLRSPALVHVLREHFGDDVRSPEPTQSTS